MTLAVIEQETGWEPGDPLYRERTEPWGRYIFNFRDDSREQHCWCSDAASWPLPKHDHDLDWLDELARNAGGDYDWGIHVLPEPVEEEAA